MAYNSVQIQTVAAFVVTYVLAALFLSARYFQSIKIQKTVDPDLIVLTVSFGLSLVYFETMNTLMTHGWGRHIEELTLQDLAAFNKHLLPNTLTYLITPSVTKIAMLVVLFRINPSKGYRTIVVGLGVAIFVYTLALTIITGGPCNPLHAGTTTCLENVALSHAVLNIASDLAVVATPIPTIHRLVTSTKQKVSVGCLLAIGSCVVICSIARLPYVVIIGTTPDVTYTEAILGIWSIVEINLGIICGCAMRLKSLLTTYLPRLGLTSGQASSGLSGGRAGNKHYQNSSGKKSGGGIRLPTDGSCGTRWPGDEAQFPDDAAGGGSHHLRSLQQGSGAGTVFETSGEELQFYKVNAKSSMGSQDKILN